MHRFNTSRRRLYVGWVIAGIFSGVLLQGVANVNLRLRLDENYLRVSAPHLHFLTGRPLERLKNGSSVLYSVQLGLSSDQFATVERRSFDRFVISYDIWEEKFSAVRLGAAKAAASHLDSSAAEDWCVNKIGMLTHGLQKEANYWVRLEMRAEEPRDATALLTQPPVALAKLVELFARPPKRETDQWAVDQGPFRVADLKP